MEKAISGGDYEKLVVYDWKYATCNSELGPSVLFLFSLLHFRSWTMVCHIGFCFGC
jgi:hypothetical protein